MTHTLHRGACPDDFVILGMTSPRCGLADRAERLRGFADIVLAHHPLSCGDMRGEGNGGGDDDALRRAIVHDSIVHAVFSDAPTVSRVLAALAVADLGVSVVVSGPLEQAVSCCRDGGREPHTIALSLGVFGCAARLPAGDAVAIASLCGHGLVGFPLIAEMARRVAAGETSCAQAAATLARPCGCGVFNTPLAARHLERLVAAGGATVTTAGGS